MSLAQRQISLAKGETEASLAAARSLRDQWVVATSQNPTGLTQKEIEHLGKAFKNRLLTIKWDSEDLVELLSGEKNDKTLEELTEMRQFIQECRDEIASGMKQLEDYESDRRIFNKHGITTTTTTTTAEATLPNNIVAQAMTSVASIIQNPMHVSHYDRLSNERLDQDEPTDGGELPHFDKGQIETSTTIFNNALYEHFEEEDSLTKTINATKVFNNLTRPSADDICVGTNENEMILEMLETEYYNPPDGLLAKSKYNTALRNLIDADRNKFLGTIALFFSFPILLILFLVI